MRLRLSGVVAALTQTRRRLRVGVPEGERSHLLEEVARVVREIEETCAGYDATPGDLPTPSRNAYAELRRIAAISPEDLPAPVDGGPEEEHPEPSPPRLRISRVVSTLNRTLDALAVADPEGPSIAPLREGVRRCVEFVERACEDESTPPSALPKQTAKAYAMLKWLDQDGAIERYLDRRDAALAAIREAIDGLDPFDDVAIKIAVKQPTLVVRFDPGRHVYRLNGRGPRLIVRLGLGFLYADDEDLKRTAQIILRRGRAPDFLRAQQQAFIDSEDYGAIDAELDMFLGGTTYRPQGRAYDLDRLFERLNERYFDGALLRPHLDWHHGNSRVRFGFYASARDLVCVDARLDDASVPEFVAEFVLYHELLHKKHGATQRRGRCHVHTAAFRADERRHPRQAEAEVWLDKLARS
jgi:hypothetical protein